MVTVGNNILNIWACMQRCISNFIDKAARKITKPSVSQKASL